MSVHDRTLAIIESFYDAALDETLWPAALRRLTELTGSQASSFWVLDGSDSPRLPTFISFNFDPKSTQEYVDGIASLDPTVRHLVAHPQQAIIHDGLLKNDQDEKSRAYYDWHERKIETRFRMVGQARLAPGVQAGIALHRTRKAGRYEAEDIERFAVLHGHLQRALAIGVRVGSLGAMQRFSQEWLDQSPAAILLLDHNRRIVFLNRSAQALQFAGDGIRLNPAGIFLSSKRDNGRLQSLIAQALLPASSSGTSAGGTMSAARPSGKRSYGIFVAPISSQSPALALFRPAVCVVITDPAREELPPTQHFQRLFGLTQAEARLAARLAVGEELRVAAEKLGITYGTARSRLAQLFQKTDTRRQGELIRLLLATLMAR